MKSVLFVTTNEGKVSEVRKILKKLHIKVRRVELREEKHLTHPQLVRLKALHAFEVLRKPVVVEDTCLFIDGFKDYPGLRSKEVFNKIGLKGFVSKCGGRKAFFRTIAAYCDGRRVFLFTGVCKGRISKTIAGQSIVGLPFLRIFIPLGFDKPVAAFSKKDLKKFLFEENHRAKAFKKLEKWILANRG